jgi:hypothetical protein
VIHIFSNLKVRSCVYDVWCDFGTISRHTSEVAKRAHAATIDKAKYAFTATGIYPYRPNFVSNEVLK